MPRSQEKLRTLVEGRIKNSSSQRDHLAEPMEGGPLLECCLEGIESAIQARDGGAHRVELCANLAQGGVTPSIGDIEATVSALRGSGTKVHVLIRPRPGHFVYSADEIEVMARDVKAAAEAGARGVVIGALLASGEIDEATTKLLREAASPRCTVTFHRAFDCCTTEPLTALETLVRLGVDRVLTSGRAANAWDGRDVIRELVRRCIGRISVMPGAGVSRANVRDLLLHTAAREVHVGSDCCESVEQSNPLGYTRKLVREGRTNDQAGLLEQGVCIASGDGRDASGRALTFADLAPQ